MSPEAERIDTVPAKTVRMVFVASGPRRCGSGRRRTGGSRAFGVAKSRRSLLRK
jgi:hypothetical protein